MFDLRLLLACILLGNVMSHAVAQDLEKDTPADASSEIEQLYDKEEAKPQASKPQPQNSKREAAKPVQTLSDLATLAPFSDVAVIQRRFLPKTKRFEFSGTAFSNLNNPFFNQIGASARAAYYIREQHAVEIIAAFAGNMERQVTTDLKGKGIRTTNALTSNGFFVAAYKWNPIYGKITFMNKAIVPFDLNFNVGGGITSTSDKQNLGTLHFGTSQVFALSKSMAFRWDLIWNMYSGNGVDNNNRKTPVTQSDLFLGVGMSFYFPEATYR